jgi:hypothetical protein
LNIAVYLNNVEVVIIDLHNGQQGRGTLAAGLIIESDGKVGDRIVILRM